MKKLLCVVLTILTAVSLFGCSSQKKDDIQNPVSFYYLYTDRDYGTNPNVIGKEIRDAEGRQNDYAYLLSLYLKGPEDYSFYRPFPIRTALVNLELQNDTALIQMNYAFAGQTGMGLSISCACITMTVCEMTGVKQVTISVPGTTLDGNPSITMSPDNLLLQDDSNIVIDPN